MIDAGNAEPFGFAPKARGALESLESGRAAFDAQGAPRLEPERAAAEAEAARIREHGAALAVRIAAAPARGLVLLKARLADPEIAEATRAALRGIGALGPAQDFPGPLRRRLTGERGAFWLAPDALWVAAPYAEAEATAAALDAALAGRSRLVQTVSDAWAGFYLIGEGTRAALAKGAALDLAPGAFGLRDDGEADFRRLPVGGFPAALHPLEGAAEGFELLCRRSEAEGVWLWLRRAARAGSLPEVWPENWPAGRAGAADRSGP